MLRYFLHVRIWTLTLTFNDRRFPRLPIPTTYNPETPKQSVQHVTPFHSSFSGWWPRWSELGSRTWTRGPCC
jgi:hypothetical protein